MALIILTWKFDSRPTSRGSLTPGKLEPVSLIHEPQHSTKDLTSPVSWLTGRTDGKRNFSWFKRKVFGLLLFFFFSFPSKPQESQYLECEGETIFIKSANNISLIIDVRLLFLLHIITSVLLSCHVLPHHSAPV